jgi:uncharacterized protein DUF6644
MVPEFLDTFLLATVTWLAATRASVAMAESVWLFPIVESVHVLGLALFLGMAVLLDLRLLGWFMRGLRLSTVVRRVLPWTVTGFGVMVVSGALTFLNAPVRYYTNVFFRAKVAMLLLAGLNAWIFHAGVYRRVEEWDRDRVTPVAARMAGMLSLVLWASIVVAGRMIAYNWFDE